jgi:hypothetical protein
MAQEVSFEQLNYAAGLDSPDGEEVMRPELKTENLARKDNKKGSYTVTPEDDPSEVAKKSEEKLAKERESGKEGYKPEYTETGRIKYCPAESLDIKPWVLAEIPLNCFVIEYGKRRTGKSFWTRDFLSQLAGKFYVATVHTDTKFNGFFQEFVDEDYIYDGYNDEALGRLFMKNRNLVQMRMQGLIPENMHIFALAWLDDVVADNTLRYSKWMARAATQGRHFDMMVGINTQHGTSVPPTWRENADIVVIFTQIHLATKEMLAREYFGMLNMRTAMELIDMYTEEHGCLVLELWRNSNRPEEFIFHYRADEPAEFRVVPPLPTNVVEALAKQEDLQENPEYQANYEWIN